MINTSTIDMLVNHYGTPLYVYEEDEIRRNHKQIIDSFSWDNAQIHYAVMCNSNKGILRIIRDLMSGVQINSLHEFDLVWKAGFSADIISFTSTGLDTKTLETLVQKGIQLNLDSVEEVKKYSKLNPGSKFGIRLKIEGIELPESHINLQRDPETGITQKDFERVKKFAKKYGCKINGIHGYLASNISSQEPLVLFGDYLAKYAEQFPDLEYINFGGGFGVSHDRGLDDSIIQNVAVHYSQIIQILSEKFNRSISLKIEPGRSLLATAGTLYTRVTNVKKLKDKKQIAVDAGFAEFARPKIYGAYHPIEVLGKEGEEELYDIRANTCLQSDFLGRDRKLPKVKEGDILAVKNVGAYGIAMSSGFPGKELPTEVIIHSDGKIERFRNLKVSRDY